MTTMWSKSNLINILVELVIYLIIDNITKCIVAQKKKENHFDILLYECLFLGFLIGFISFYYHVPYVLVCFLCFHTLGTIYSAKGFTKIIATIKIIFQLLGRLIKYLCIKIANLFSRSSSLKTLEQNKIPKQYKYNFHLKPTNDMRLQQSSFTQTLPRPGIINLYGTTCSLNSLLQSLASLNKFYSSLQHNINLSRFNYNPVVSAFLHLISQLRNDHRTSEYKHWNKLIDTSTLITQLNSVYSNLLTPNSTADICELFQSCIDILNDSLSQQSTVYATNVIEQVQNSKLTTLSFENLNKLFLEIEEQIHEKITLDDLDSQTSNIIQYVDITWLLHHIQFGSTIKHTFSGQLLHAHCCNNCSHVHFRAEPFQILTLSINRASQTLEEVIATLTKIEIIESISCSYCTSQLKNEQDRIIKHDAILSKITSTVSPIVTSRRQISDHILSSTPISSSITNMIPSAKIHIHHRIKSQIMISNFPDVLCIQLKRFSYDRFSNKTMKLTTPIIIEPEKNLDLSPFHYTTWLGLTNLSISYHYRLVAACLHLSENSSQKLNGHYVCVYRTDNNQWSLSDDEHLIMTMICIICFNNHTEDDCPDFVSSSRMNGTEKKPSSSLTRNLSKVLLSLPTQIQMHRCDDTITFSPTIRILKTTIIGPFEGRFIPEDKLTTAPRNGFLVKIFRENGNNLVLDASDERRNNWCCLIPPARTSQEINCLLFQRKCKLYAKVVRTILATESLSIWYSSNYAKAIGMPETPDGGPLALYGKTGRMIFR
ncbi:unnamed protein product [Rotaria socialis]|uniref:ubiquitinyl hydrolase 1 n=1 Tax=Rotaria socialis TaxID=392032 RepID=A0A818JMQ9_9BILA|nr:unnamed protein product [Rotaria socialis]